MRKLIYSLLLLMVTSSSFAQDQVWGGPFSGKVVVQRYHTWCVFAVLSMNSGYDQVHYATRYAQIYLGAPSTLDCAVVYNDISVYGVCVAHSGVDLSQIVTFCNSCSSNFLPFRHLINFDAWFNIGMNYSMPFMGILLDTSTNYAHAVHLFYVALYNAGQINQYRMMRYIDPWDASIGYGDSFTIRMDVATY
ncbi:hypothetical protein [Butyricimonas sp.]|uniref:hypothetical protein n=1 Tax=Butyricimonas sp. TaxID=1969738 RepID=UPI0025BDD3EF|nr:hypothetical protein [Butyricimonas sp.]